MYVSIYAMSNRGQGTPGACSTLAFQSRHGRAKLCRDTGVLGSLPQLTTTVLRNYNATCVTCVPCGIIKSFEKQGFKDMEEQILSPREQRAADPSPSMTHVMKRRGVLCSPSGPGLAYVLTSTRSCLPTSLQVPYSLKIFISSNVSSNVPK
jgi:hypothetical protein